MQWFGFRFDPRYSWGLKIVGITPSRSEVVIDGDLLIVRFGPWRVSTPLDNVCGTQVTGNYKAYRAIGPHLSVKDRGISFGTNTERGVCICFKEPVRSKGPFRFFPFRHPALTVTVEDVDGLVLALTKP